MPLFEFSQTLAGGTEAVIGEIILPDAASPILIQAELQNHAAGGAAINSFEVEVQPHPDSDWYVYISEDDFNNPNNPIFVWTTAPGLNVLASGSTIGFAVKIAVPVYGVRFEAASAAEALCSMRGSWIPYTAVLQL